MAAYPDYFISPLRINGSAIESIFSVLKFTAGGNLSVRNYGSFRGRVITGREVITNSNSERGYRDDIILGRVVRKPVNANPGLKVNRGKNFSCIKVLSIAYVLCSLRLLVLKTKGQKI